MPDPSPDLVERANRARRFPANTCGASRHAQGVAEAMMQGDVLPEVTDDPTHIGESILSTVAALYEARSEITRLQAENQALRKRMSAMWGVGEVLSNCAFNLAQKRGEPLTDSVCATLDTCRKQWDDITKDHP